VQQAAGSRQTDECAAAECARADPRLFGRQAVVGSFDLPQSAEPLKAHIAFMAQIIIATLPYFTVVGAFAYFFCQGIW
jgi:hypothetical protein